jgi:hypothetical protein
MILDIQQIFSYTVIVGCTSKNKQRVHSKLALNREPWTGA